MSGSQTAPGRDVACEFSFLSTSPLSIRRPVLSSVAMRGESLVAGVVAGFGALAILTLAPPGVDFAAHAYQRTLFLAHGFTLWNNFWYAGRYSFIGYSLVYYPLAGFLGTTLLAVVSTTITAIVFSILVCREWGRSARLSSRAFAAVWPASILAAAFPFALGVALAMVAVCALQRARTRWFAVFTLLALAASPLAFVILAVVSLGIAAGRLPQRARLVGPAAVVVSVGAAQFVVMRLFPSAGVFPFSFFQLLPALMFSLGGVLLTCRTPRARSLSGFFGAYGVVCLGAFAIPSSLGSNIERVRYAAIPLALLVLALRKRTPHAVTLCVLVFAATWNLTPAVSALSRASIDENPSYWKPVIAYLRAHLSTSYRVEVVDTSDHWAAAYLPDAGIPIARGWFRQDDFPQNAVLYNRRIARVDYLRWLHKLSVRFVVLTDAPPDYSAEAERRLIRSGRSGLRVVRRARHFTIYAVPDPSPLITGPARVTVLDLGASEVVASVAAPGRYHIAVKWSPYWFANAACVQESPNGQVLLTVARRGTVAVRFNLDFARGFETLIGTTPNRRCDVRHTPSR